MSEDCNVEDIMCHVNTLKSLRELRTSMGSESFMSEFPELEGLEGKLSDKIENTEGGLEALLERCGNEDLAKIDISETSDEEGDE